MPDAASNKVTGSNTWVQLETLVSVVAIMFLLSASYFSTKHQIEGLETRVEMIENSNVTINKKLDKILASQSLEAALATIYNSDRWTATMQKDFQDIWFELVRAWHPDIQKHQIPDIRDIQNDYPQGVYSMRNAETK